MHRTCMHAPAGCDAEEVGRAACRVCERCGLGTEAAVRRVQLQSRFTTAALSSPGLIVGGGWGQPPAAGHAPLR